MTEDSSTTHCPDNSETILCRGRTLNLSSPVVMGILNTTPDSFSDGGEFTDLPVALSRVSQMIREGARIIDIGGESTRPGAEPVSEQLEIGRTIPVLKEAVVAHPDSLFSIDTTKYGVAKAALEAGAHIINDISGLQKEPRFSDLCAESGAAYVCMHSQGDPQTMQKEPEYEDAVEDIYSYLSEKLLYLTGKGVDNVIIDPGIGFGKTLKHNLQLIARLSKFKELKSPILIGASRKTSIGEILGGRPADGRLAGTIALHYQCLLNGASVIRVHDVQEAVDSVKIYNAVQSAVKEE